MGAGVVVVFYSLSFIKKEGSEHNMVLLIELGRGGGGGGGIRTASVEHAD